MGTKVNAEVLNIDIVLRKLTQYEQANIAEALGKSAALVEASAKDNLLSGGHIKSGELVRSISYDVEGNQAKVFTTVPYATYVEFGTGTYAENGDGRPGWWVYVDESCGAPKSKVRNIYTYEQACKVWHSLAKIYGPDNVYITNGQKPTRFLRDALDTNKEDIKKLLQESVKGVR